MTAEVVALTEEVRAALAMMSTVLERLDRADRRQVELAKDALVLAEETRRVAKATTRHRIGSWVLALCVVSLAGLGLAFRQDQINERYRTCVRSNEIRSDIRQSIVNTVELLAARSPNYDPAVLAVLLDSIEANLVETLPDRVCS